MDYIYLEGKFLVSGGLVLCCYFTNSIPNWKYNLSIYGSTFLNIQLTFILPPYTFIIIYH